MLHTNRMLHSILACLSAGEVHAVSLHTLVLLPQSSACSAVGRCRQVGVGASTLQLAEEGAGSLTPVGQPLSLCPSLLFSSLPISISALSQQVFSPKHHSPSSILLVSLSPSPEDVLTGRASLMGRKLQPLSRQEHLSSRLLGVHRWACSFAQG